MFAELFDEILIWPLEIVTRLKEPQEWAAWIIRGGGGAWEKIQDLQRREETSSEQVSYTEFVYFHPFVQRFLYGIQANGDKAPLRILKRTDIRKVEVEVRGQGGVVLPKQVLDVRHVHLYLTTTRVAILVVGVASQKGQRMERGWVLDFQDQFRRAYPAYWEDGKAGHCPEKVTWLGEKGQLIPDASNYEKDAPSLHDAFKRKRPPVAAHWRSLLEPMVQYDESTHEGEGPKEVRFRHIEDERIPAMCYVAHPRPAAITRGDFVRLAFCDGDGSPETLSYGTDFLADFERRYCYDRFWDPRTEGHGWMSTRYLCSGYAFTVVGDASDRFFTNADSGLLAHFRHHYFQMGLIVQFHKASLLVFSDRLAKAVTLLPDEAKFHDRVKKLQKQIAEFVSRFWFEEISNELQAYELFHWWSGHVNNPNRFGQVMTEVQSVAATLSAIQGERREKEASRLSTIAAVGVPVALVLTALSIPDMGRLFQDLTPRSSSPPLRLTPMQWTTVLWAALSGAAFRIWLWLYRKWRR